MKKRTKLPVTVAPGLPHAAKSIVLVQGEPNSRSRHRNRGRSMTLPYRRGYLTCQPGLPTPPPPGGGTPSRVVRADRSPPGAAGAPRSVRDGPTRRRPVEPPGSFPFLFVACIRTAAVCSLPADLSNSLVPAAQSVAPPAWVSREFCPIRTASVHEL